MESRSLLDPQFVSRLNALDLQARSVVEGFLAGLHKSPYHGFSVEFAEYRPYMEGEGIRHLDWKKYARSDRLVVKEYQDSTNLSAYLVIDTSGSMAYSSGTWMEKFQYARVLAGALSYLLLHQRDAVGLSCLRGNEACVIAPQSVRAHLHRLISLLEGLTCGGDSALASLLGDLAERAGRRSLVAVFSDCMEDPNPLMRAFRHLRYCGHELILFHVLDPAEPEFSFKNPHVFTDVESGMRMPIHPNDVRNEYRRLFREHAEQLRESCLQIRADYQQLLTDQPFEAALTAFLQMRKRIFHV